MTTQPDNKAVLRRVAEECFNNGNLAVLDEIFASQDSINDKRQFIPALRTAFPDLHCTIEELIEEGDKVALRATMSGTNAGAWQGRPPTGRKISWQLMVFNRFEGGKIVEEWVNIDGLNILEQLGSTFQPAAMTY